MKLLSQRCKFFGRAFCLGDEAFLVGHLLHEGLVLGRHLLGEGVHRRQLGGLGFALHAADFLGLQAHLPAQVEHGVAGAHGCKAFALGEGKTREFARFAGRSGARGS